MVAANILKPEIVAPAGDWAGLRAALEAGCDAVYFGVRGLNMRASAHNFSSSSMKRVVGLCREAGARAYLALNVLIYERELARVRSILRQAHEAGVDAVIGWDFAVLQEARRAGLPVHVSTQMSVANSASLLWLRRHAGVRRFVLARECSLSDIKTMRRAFAREGGPEGPAVELEVFAHGAMCVSLSGRCLMSQFRHGVSANRGQCRQPCRREYRIEADDGGFVIGSGYVLSPRDLCTLPFIEKLIGAGVSSLKIEGRGRSAEYVGTVTRSYRRAVDFYVDNRGKAGGRAAFERLKQELLCDLAKVYNRGFSSGFFLGKPLDQWAEGSGSQAAVRKEYAGVVTRYYPRAGVAEIRVESNAFSTGDELLFEGAATGAFSQIARSIEIHHRKVAAAMKGSVVALRTDRAARKHDRVYVLKPARTG